MGVRSILKKMLVSPELEKQVANIKKPVGVYGYDPWGYHTDTFMVALSIFKKMFDNYFRVESHGLENVPDEGRAMVIANHSGQLPMDGIMIGIAIATRDHAPRAARAMVERFFPTVPFIGNFLNQVGAVIGDPVNCVKMLQNDEVIVVFPEGVRGSGKPYRKKYQLQRFGNGFMHIAIANKTPIIPVGVVGCEETIPSLGDIKPLAKLIGIPYVPIAFPLPLPAKVILNFGEPMVFEGDIDNEKSVTEKVETVKNEIRRLIKKGRSERKGVFYG
ncbi:MAG: acyltransferase family protein [Deltaproteobacteria bacterium]|nr:acyltransferase family protein [Deltaproteobacteria bacterium]